MVLEQRLLKGSGSTAAHQAGLPSAAAAEPPGWPMDGQAAVAREMAIQADRGVIAQRCMAARGVGHMALACRGMRFQGSPRRGTVARRDSSIHTAPAIKPQLIRAADQCPRASHRPEGVVSRGTCRAGWLRTSTPVARQARFALHRFWICTGLSWLQKRRGTPLNPDWRAIGGARPAIIRAARLLPFPFQCRVTSAREELPTP